MGSCKLPLPPSLPPCLQTADRLAQALEEHAESGEEVDTHASASCHSLPYLACRPQAGWRKHWSSMLINYNNSPKVSCCKLLLPPSPAPCLQTADRLAQALEEHAESGEEVDTHASTSCPSFPIWPADRRLAGAR